MYVLSCYFFSDSVPGPRLYFILKKKKKKNTVNDIIV